MRKQYHFRQIGDDTWIWDVDDLIALSANLAQIDVPLTHFKELDEPYWAEAGFTCRAIAEHAQLIQAADLRYPVILCADGRVMDGMHRICKALLLDQKAVKAVRFKQTPPPKYFNIHPSDLSYER